MRINSEATTIRKKDPGRRLKIIEIKR